MAAVHIENSSNIIVENLEVTNWESDEDDLLALGSYTPSQTGVPGKFTKRQSKSLLTGILVENHDQGELDGVTVRNNKVHHVNGRMDSEAKKGTGGIVALVTGSSKESSFTNLDISGNEVYDVCHQGIYMESSWASRPLVLKDDTGKPGTGQNDWVGWKDVYVSHNYVHEVAGDGIVLINADGGIAEHNLVVASADEDWNYSENPAHAAIWMWDCNNVTMQYNESANTESYQDGMSFDFDYGNQNVLYQYNYSHGNKGGFWMSCPGPAYTVNAVARYNISINDGLFDGARMIRVGEKGSVGNQFYNNTMYWDHGYKINAVEAGSWGTRGTSGTDIFNNIFCGDSDMVIADKNVHYSNNCVYGSIADAYPVEKDPNVVIADPQFVDPSQAEAGKQPMGSFSDGKVTIGVPDGFKLKSTSPCIDAGRDYPEVPTKNNIPDAVKGNFTAVMNELVDTQIEKVTEDYFGNPAPYDDGIHSAIVDIGAAEYQGQPEKASESDMEYLRRLIEKVKGYDTAAFVDSTCTALESSVEAGEALLKEETAAKGKYDAVVKNLEDALDSLVRTDMIQKESENAITNADNSGFEGKTNSWGPWPEKASVSVSAEKAHTGEKSLKVNKGTVNNETVFAELGGVAVEKGADYLCTAWIYCGSDDISKVSLGAKYHKNNTVANSDINIAEAYPSAKAEESGAEGDAGWRQVTFVFTAKDDSSVIKKSEISLVLSSNTDTVYLDDVELVKYSVKAGTDKSSLEQAIESLKPEHDEAAYTEDSYKAYLDAMIDARVTAADVMATEAEVKAAETTLKSAFAGLLLQDTANKAELQKVYDEYKVIEQGNFTDASWKVFTAALKEADRVLGVENASKDDIAGALSGLNSAYAGLVEKGDKTALRESCDKYSSYDKTQYTEESWKAFAEALENAERVLEDENADQTAVDSALKLLEEKAGLLKKTEGSGGGQGSEGGSGQGSGDGSGQGSGDGNGQGSGDGSGQGSGDGSGQESEDGDRAVRTGDDSSAVPILLLLVVSGTAAAGAVYVIRKQRRRGHDKIR